MAFAIRTIRDKSEIQPKDLIRCGPIEKDRGFLCIFVGQRWNLSNCLPDN